MAAVQLEAGKALCKPTTKSERKRSKIESNYIQHLCLPCKLKIRIGGSKMEEKRSLQQSGNKVNIKQKTKA
jgi:hypothetical protein